MSNLSEQIAQLSPEKRELLLRQLQQRRQQTKEQPRLIERQSRAANIFPLSFAQQRLWFLDQLEPNSSAYNMPAALKLSGQLNIRALRQSLLEIIRRHESLRTVFSTHNEQPVQIILPKLLIAIPVIDLRALSSAQRQKEVRWLAAQAAEVPFDLVNGPLLRVAVLKLANFEHILLFTTHHIISDGWSNGVLIREFTTLYAAFSTNHPSPLPELPIQYADFAVWQRQHLQGEALANQLRYWEKTLSQAPSQLKLSTDHPRSARQNCLAGGQPWQLAYSLTEALKAISRQEKVTLFITLLTLFKCLLYRYTGQADVLVGTPIANRNRVELEGLVGFFANTLVMRSVISGNQSFRALLGQVRRVALSAYTHQDLPFEQLVDTLRLERDLSYHPLFQVMFTLQRAPMDNQSLPGLTISSFNEGNRGAKFDLSCMLWETETGLEGLLEYNADLFEASTIARMGQHFQTLIEGAVNHPDLPLADLPLLSAAEHQQLLVDWNQTQVDTPHSEIVHQLFEAQVERTPDAIAVVLDTHSVTYQALNQRANQLAHYLRQLGVVPETLVGVYMERSIEMIVGLLAILKAGGAYVPLDPSYPKTRLQFMLADANVNVLLTQQHLLERLEDLSYEGNLQTVCLDRDWSTMARLSRENPATLVTHHNLAYAMYTSGSSGQPKGVQIEHVALHNLVAWHAKTFRPSLEDRVSQFASLSFDASSWEIWHCLSTGASLYIVPEQYRLSPLAFQKWLGAQQITVGFLPTPVLEAFLAIPWTDANHCLETLHTGGAPLLSVPQVAFPFAIINDYGPSECTVITTYDQVDVQRHNRLLPSIGRPIANIQVYLLDAYGQPVPIGVPGELHVSGIGLARGYLNRPELTAEKFIANPFGSGRLYKTGDLTRYRSDGTIEFLGRIDHQIKMRGFRIELGEIEAALHGHASIQQALVVAQAEVDAPTRLIAYVVPAVGYAPTPSELRHYLKQQLPEYMLPSVFMLLQAFPLTPNGKVDRQALPASSQLRPELIETFVAPRTPIEVLLADIWSQVLGVEQVGVWDNFFELGGHSLLVTQVMSRVRQNLAIDLPLRYLFEFPTVAEFAKMVQRQIDQANAPFTPPITPVERTHNYPLSFAQERLWFLEQLQSGIFAHNIPTAVRLTGPLDVAAVELSLNEIVQRHEVLRVTFQVIDGHPMQVLESTAHVVVPVVDLQALAASVQAATVQDLVHTEIRCPFDLTQGPLLRCTLLKLAETEHIALFTMHHIVSDGWSMGVLIRELAVFYQGFAACRPVSLPPLPIQYADFTLWQRQWLQDENLEHHLEYWRRQLAGSNSLQLPTDYSPSGISSYRGKTHTWQLSPEVSQSLVGLSRQAGVTLFMTLMAAFKILLHRQNKQTDIVLGTDIANRNRAEVEQLIGFFVNIVVLRTSLAGNPTFQELLRRVFDVSMAAYAHQDLPFSKLVEALQPDRHSSATPLFQVLFVMQNNPVTTVEFSELTLSPIATDNETVKFDLVLFVAETEDGIVGSWRYNADLFAANTIARLSEQFKTLLEDIVRQPEARIDALNILSEAEKQQQAALAAQKTQKKRKKFMRVQPKTVTLPQKALIKTGFLPSQPELPLVLEPDHPGVNLIDWAQSHRATLETQLLQHGALLFRGFQLTSVETFERLAQAICPALFSEYGDLPRESVGGNVYGSTPYPADQAIRFHHESSHLSRWPLKIWFFCVQPAQQGGETPIVDGRKVYQALPTQLREKFEQKQLRYMRNYTEGLDVSWQSFFHTSDKRQVEAYCHKAGILPEWKEPDDLRTYQIRPAIAHHHKTGDKVFFNQILLHHLACLDTATQTSLLSSLGEANLPRHVYYGDGTPIEPDEIAIVKTIYKETAVSFRWQQGDVLMLDNMLIGHGRYAYQGPRKIVVAMGEMIGSEV